MIYLKAVNDKIYFNSTNPIFDNVAELW